MSIRQVVSLWRAFYFIPVDLSFFAETTYFGGVWYFHGVLHAVLYAATLLRGHILPMLYL